MKSKVHLLLVCSIISTGVFFGLWQHEKNSDAELVLIATSSVNESLIAFNEYLSNSHDTSYISGVAAFDSFQKAVFSLVDKNPQSISYSNHLLINNTCADLIFSEKKSKENIKLFIEVLTMLSKNINDPNAYARMENFNNIIHSNS